MKFKNASIDEQFRQIIASIDLLFNHEHMDMAIMIIDAAGICVYVNDLLQGFTGLQVGADLKKMEHVASLLFQAMEKREVMKTVRKMPMKDFVLHIDITAFPIVLNGETVGALGYGLNITERMELQNSLVKTERLTLVGEMAGRIIHDLRNPLRMTRATLDSIEMNQARGTLTGEDLLVDLHRARMAVDHISDLLNNLLQFSKPQGSGWKDLMVEECVHDVVDYFSGRLQREQIHCDFDVEPGLMMNGDPKLLKQVISNLLQNAIDELKGYDDERRIEIIGRQDGADVLLTIFNTGLPIEENHIEKIFDLFFSTKGRAGSGLGLPITRDIVETTFFGKIWCESNLQISGTRFFVRLPRNIDEVKEIS